MHQKLQKVGCRTKIIHLSEEATLPAEKIMPVEKNLTVEKILLVEAISPEEAIKEMRFGTLALPRPCAEHIE